mmetsp:Transcript_58133/g.126260  ORF Transcript_58133/g.126260 Transcript_58133/m.126260 type:complete len:150 (-) Transcript_58133:126-575(-)
MYLLPLCDAYRGLWMARAKKLPSATRRCKACIRRVGEGSRTCAVRATSKAVHNSLARIVAATRQGCRGPDCLVYATAATAATLAAVTAANAAIAANTNAAAAIVTAAAVSPRSEKERDAGLSLAETLRDLLRKRLFEMLYLVMIFLSLC